MSNRSFEELQRVLHYQFKDPALLRIAMTHSSFANESKVPTQYNERLEFLGDSVLSVVVADYLFHHSTRPEGELTRMRASLVSEEALFAFAKTIDLGRYLRLGHGEELSGGRTRPSVVSDAPFITEGATAAEDYKTRLQELVQERPGAQLQYAVTGEEGPDHDKTFTVEVTLDGKVLAAGTGRSKKAAEQQAACAALARLQRG